MTPEEKFKLISRNLQEVIGDDIIEEVLKKRDLSLYWGTAPTGRPHCGYFVPMTKLADFLKADCEVTILVADIHAFLDNMKAPWELVQHRAKYYKFLIVSILKSINVPIERLKFVIGSDYQYSKEYTRDNFRMCALVTEHDALRAGSEVVKQVESPVLSGLMYPGMQALDEEHLGVDAQFGGVDQRKIFILAQDYLPRLGYRKRAHLMNPMVPGLAGGKMSASLGAENKIDLLDDPTTVKKKVSKAYCAAGIVEDNGILAFVKHVIIPISELKGEAQFYINRPEKYGGPLNYSSYEQLENEFIEQKLSPQDLKIGVTDSINALLEPIRKEYDASAEFQEVTKLAYPPPESPAPKKKKEKKVNPRHVNANSNQADGNQLSEQTANLNVS